MRHTVTILPTYKHVHTCTGVCDPITISGLLPNTAYTFAAAIIECDTATTPETQVRTCDTLEASVDRLRHYIYMHIHFVHVNDALNLQVHIYICIYIWILQRSTKSTTVSHVCALIVNLTLAVESVVISIHTHNSLHMQINQHNSSNNKHQQHKKPIIGMTGPPIETSLPLQLSVLWSQLACSAYTLGMSCNDSSIQTYNDTAGKYARASLAYTELFVEKYLENNSRDSSIQGCSQMILQAHVRAVLVMMQLAANK